MLRFLGFIVFLALVVLVVGFFAGWFRFSTVVGGERSEVSLSIDNEAIGEDLAKVKEKAEGLANAARKGSVPELVGAVVSVDPAGRRIELRPEKGEPAWFTVDMNARIMLNNESVSLDDLTRWDRVVVTFEVRRDERVATAIAATRS